MCTHERIHFLTATSKPSEIAKRTAIFTAVGQLGSMFAGIMMTAMYKTMEGHGGLKGWQWVFLISERYVEYYNFGADR